MMKYQLSVNIDGGSMGHEYLGEFDHLFEAQNFALDYENIDHPCRYDFEIDETQPDGKVTRSFDRSEGEPEWRQI